MKTIAFFAFLFAVVPTMARHNMRTLYRVDLGAELPAAANTDEFGSWRQLGIPTEMSMPADEAMSMPLDADFSFPMDAGMSFPLDDAGFSMPFESDMSMPYTCDTTYDCPAADTCDCGGMVQDGGEICGCYSVTSVPAPFDTDAIPPSGTWYCYQVDLDKTADGCGDARAVSHSVLATGFSETCLFHPGGLDVDGSDDWFYQTCDNTAATGLKFDFGHTGDSDQLSVTYCFDVSCEAAPAGEGSINWVLKAANDRCEIEVTEGAIPNCGVSSDLCHPSCPADDGDGGNGNGGGGGGNNGGGNKNEANEPESSTKTAPITDGGSDEKNLGVILGPILGVAAVAAIAGVVYLKAKGAAAGGADAASLSSADTPPVVA